MTITYHASNNNGSFLQAYALQHTLIHRFHVENQIIDFRSKELLDNYRLYRKPDNLKNLYKNFYSLLHHSKLKTREDRFETMRRQYLNMTPRLNLLSEFDDLQTECDLFIAGSDQIWNTKAPDFNIAFFLPGRTNKIAYGISFGSNLAQIDLSGYKSYIDEFSALSTRENQSIAQLSRQSKQVVSPVVDPTMLMNKQDYEIFEQKTPLQNGSYIFYYSMKYTKSGLEQVKKLSRELHLPIVTVFTNYHTSYCSRYGIKIRFDAGPTEFLNLISHATLVATDSYHGIVFSILFHQKFVYLRDHQKDDDRIESLLEQLGLNNDSIESSDQNTMKDLNINWDLIDEKIDQLKNCSLAYLQTILEVQKEKLRGHNESNI